MLWTAQQDIDFMIRFLEGDMHETHYIAMDEADAKHVRVPRL